MNKVIKKISAASLAFAISIGSLMTCANAAFEEKTFSVKYVKSPNYIPSDVNSGTTVRLVASADTYTGVITDMTALANRSVTITSTTHEIINTYSDLIFKATPHNYCRSIAQLFFRQIV